MAAYCGIEYFDSSAYPESYRDKLYMGNIHGSCINVDRIERSGATYKGFGEPDFMTANDVWFMPVAQKVGPDGCLYVLDWYDRYHCYQDAQADPKGIDRGHGRLYRVVYQERPKTESIEFAKQSNNNLVKLLTDDNLYNRQQAQLEFAERSIMMQDLTTAKLLFEKTLDDSLPMKHRMHALWALIGSGRVPDQWLLQWLRSSDPVVRSWGVRTTGDKQSRNATVHDQLSKLASDPDPRVRLQVAIAANKLFDSSTATDLLLSVLENSTPDAILPNVVWQNLLPHLIQERERVSDAMIQNATKHPLLATIGPRVASRWMSDVSSTVEEDEDILFLWSVFAVASSLAESHPAEAAATVDVIFDKVATGELRGDTLKTQLASWVEQKANVSENERWKQSLEKLQIITGDQSAIAKAKLKSSRSIRRPRFELLNCERPLWVRRPQFREPFIRPSINCWLENQSMRLIAIPC